MVFIDALVGHVPIEISQLLNHFLTTGEEENYLEAEVLGKRKRNQLGGACQVQSNNQRQTIC